MFTGLTIVRDGLADDVPLTVNVTKCSGFAEDSAEVSFKTEVWISQLGLNEQFAALGNFIEQIDNRDSAKSFDLVLGPPHAPSGLKGHAGMCNLHFLIQPTGVIGVTTQLLAVSPGSTYGDPYDTCTVHFKTHIGDMQEFQRQMNESCAQGPVAAVLRGFEAVT